MRFNYDTIRETNGESDFLLKFDIMWKKIGGIWKDIEKKDFVAQRFKLSDVEFTMQNRREKFDIAKENWKNKHNKVRGNYKHHDHPGKMPVFIPTSQMDDNDKLNDRSNSIFHINVEEANCNSTHKPVKNGIIYWNENVNLTSYVDLYFQDDAKFTKVPNWQQIMQDSFHHWQKRRQGIDYNPIVQMSPMTSMSIMIPQDRCTISISIPFKKLKDHGNQSRLYKEVVRIFHHYNHVMNEKIFPIDKIRTLESKNFHVFQLTRS